MTTVLRFAITMHTRGRLKGAKSVLKNAREDADRDLKCKTLFFFALQQQSKKERDLRVLKKA